MKFRYVLPARVLPKALRFVEFANGGAQFSARLKDGSVWHGLLLSGNRYIIAMRNHADLPFSVDDIVDIFQTSEDLDPQDTSGWKFWDNWE